MNDQIPIRNLRTFHKGTPLEIRVSERLARQVAALIDRVNCNPPGTTSPGPIYQHARDAERMEMEGGSVANHDETQRQGAAP